MLVLTFALCAQLAAPVTRVRPVLAFPDAALDDTAAYRGYQTRLFRDASGNTLQIYLDHRANRVVHLWADAEDESLGFTARGAGGRPAALRWADDGARVSRSGRSRSVEHSLVADEPRIDVGWFLLGSMRVERDLQYANGQQAAFATGPFVVAELARLVDALESLEPGERQRHLALLHARDTRQLRERLRPRLERLSGPGVAGVAVIQPSFDGLDTLAMELRADSRLVRVDVGGDSIALVSRRRRDIPFTVRITTTGGALTPLDRRQLFNASFLDFVARSRASATSGGARARMRGERLERQVRGLELLASREKLMAGLPTYATYFGRDMLTTALMMQPVWRDETSEFVIASALRKLAPDGRVSHEEALGGQAARESASDYAGVIGELARRARQVDFRGSDSLLARARVVLRDLRRTRENYHMIDAEFQLPIVVARWIDNPRISRERKRAFLLDAADSGEPRAARLLRELALVARLATPYATDPRPHNLISFAPRDSGRWASQSWRDSNVGYGGGRFAMDVNAIWAPHALDAMRRILAAMREIGVAADSVVLARAELAPLRRYASDPSALARDIATWSDASRHFRVRLAPEDVRARVTARLAAMPEDERRHWSDLLPPAAAAIDTLDFLALSLDAAGNPIPVVNSDVGMRVFLAGESRRAASPAETRAEVLRDVRLFARRYPIGLLVDGVGPVVANDAYASPSIWRDFDRDRYHGPRVVWGRENNLFLLGAMSQLASSAASNAPRDSASVLFRRELADAIERVDAAVRASGFHSELWSYEVRGGRVVPVRYGSGSDVQLWSTTDLVVDYQRDQLRR